MGTWLAGRMSRRRKAIYLKPLVTPAYTEADYTALGCCQLDAVAREALTARAQAMLSREGSHAHKG